MQAAREAPISGRLQAAAAELQAMILDAFPSATFVLGPGPENPTELHVVTTVDVDDTDEVVDLIIDRMLEMQIGEGLPVYVIPLRQRRRALAAGSELTARSERI